MKSFITISVEDSIQTLFDAISRPCLPGKGSGFVFITDKVGSLVGSVADSDIRRFISATSRLPKTVTEVMRADPISLDSKVWRSLGWFAFAELMDARGWKLTYHE
jgi:CBS domain-containing protein